jgi:hypothetical protein
MRYVQHRQHEDHQENQVCQSGIYKKKQKQVNNKIQEQIGETETIGRGNGLPHIVEEHQVDNRYHTCATIHSINKWKAQSAFDSMNAILQSKYIKSDEIKQEHYAKAVKSQSHQFLAVLFIIQTNSNKRIEREQYNTGPGIRHHLIYKWGILSQCDKEGTNARNLESYHPEKKTINLDVKLLFVQEVDDVEKQNKNVNDNTDDLPNRAIYIGGDIRTDAINRKAGYI